MTSKSLKALLLQALLLTVLAQAGVVHAQSVEPGYISPVGTSSIPWWKFW